MNKTTLIFIGILVLVIVGGAFFLTSQGKGNPSGSHGSGSGLEAGVDDFDSVPDLSFQDIDGNTVSLTSFAGTPIVVNSWATWCPFCVTELPDFVTLQEEFGDAVVVIAINRREAAGKGTEFTDSLGITDDLVYLLDPRDTFYKTIGGFAMPETLFVDAKGNVLVHKRGFMDLEEMRQHTVSITTTNR